MLFYAVKHDLYFAAIFNTLERCFYNVYIWFGKPLDKHNYLRLAVKTKNKLQWLFHICVKFEVN